MIKLPIHYVLSKSIHLVLGVITYHLHFHIFFLLMGQPVAQSRMHYPTHFQNASEPGLAHLRGLLTQNQD